LDSQAWHPILKIPNQLAPARSSAVGPVNQTLAKLSTIISELDSLPALSDPAAEQTILKLCSLRQTINTRLHASLKQAKPEIYIPIICCKDSNYLLLIDTTLLKLLSSPNLPPTLLPLILQTFPSTTFQTDITLPTFFQFLEDEILKNFEIFRKYLVLASRATPFGMRKMCFLCRVLCEERRRREGKPHFIWGEFERAIEGVSAKGWLGKVTGTVSVESV
jgi:hypothetical protein